MSEEPKKESVEPFIRANPHTGQWEVVVDKDAEFKKAWDILMNTPILFGLKAQGHIPTIERMLKEGATWKEIGKKIGWCPETAKEDYGRYVKDIQKGGEDKNANLL